MKPAPFVYHAPETLDEALQLLDTLGNARVLAGGQSLVPMLNFRVAQPDHLIDLGRIPGLNALECRDGAVSIGAMTTQRTIERSALVRQHCPILLDALEHVGHQQTRNRGTIGGSICHLDPAAELPVVAMALNPMLEIACRTGMRTLPFEAFPVGYLTSVMEPNEILTRIEFPPWPHGAGWAFTEFARRPADFAIVSVAAMLMPGEDGRVQQANIAVGGLGSTPIRATEAEECLSGAWLEERIGQAAEAVRALPADGDFNHPAEYRLDLADALLRRALASASRRMKVPQHV